jgi:hypothetical protein
LAAAQNSSGGNSSVTPVSQIIAGSGCSISPTSGVGVVTITCSGTGGSGTVTSVSVVSTNGFAGTVATATTTPAITLSTSITGPLKGNGTALQAASAADIYNLFSGTPSATCYLSGSGACSVPAGTGVTSVGFTDASTTPIYTIGSTPVTTTGTISQTLNTQLASTVFAGPTTGGAAQPGFRALVSADIPSNAANTTGTSGGLTGTPSISVGALTAVGTTSINASGSSATNIGTGSSTGAITLGEITTGSPSTQSTINLDAPITVAQGTGYVGPAWLTNGIGLNVNAATFSDNSSSGTISQEAMYAIGAPTLTTPTNAVTVTSLVTLYVAAPIAGTHVSCTTCYGILTTGTLGTTGGALLNGTVTINNNQNGTTDINTGTSTGTAHIGDGSAASVVDIGNAAGTVTIVSGSSGTMNGVTIGGTTREPGSFTTVNANAAITGTAGLTITGAASSINASSNFATNIGTGTTTSTVTIGGGSNAVTEAATTYTGTGTTWNINASSSTNVTNIATGSTTGTLHLADGTGNAAVTIGNGTGIDTIQGPFTASNATVKLSGIANSTSAQTGTVCLGTSGALSYDNTNTCLVSDIRLKTNIKPLDAGLAEVMALHPISYDLRPEANPGHLGRQVGLSAQEVYKVDPRLAGLYSSGPEEGTPARIRYMQMTAVLVKAIQEQQAEIDSLKRQLRRHH